MKDIILNGIHNERIIEVETSKIYIVIEGREGKLISLKPGSDELLFCDVEDDQIQFLDSLGKDLILALKKYMEF